MTCLTNLTWQHSNNQLDVTLNDLYLLDLRHTQATTCSMSCTLILYVTVSVYVGQQQRLAGLVKVTCHVTIILYSSSCWLWLINFKDVCIQPSTTTWHLFKHSSVNTIAATATTQATALCQYHQAWLSVVNNNQRSTLNNNNAINTPTSWLVNQPCLVNNNNNQPTCYQPNSTIINNLSSSSTWLVLSRWQNQQPTTTTTTYRLVNACTWLLLVTLSSLCLMYLGLLLYILLLLYII